VALALTAGSGSVTAAVWTLYSPPAFYRVQQPFLLSGFMTAINTPANVSNTSPTGFSLTVYRTASGADLQQGLTLVPGYSQTYNDGTTFTQTYYNSSQTFGAGDRLHVYLSYVGAPTAQDVTVQLDLF